jgi:ubiquinone biosynthesis protein
MHCGGLHPGNTYMGISLKPEHLKRYRDIARLFLKYGHGDLVNDSGLAAALADEDSDALAADPKAAELADDLEKMGPIFVKLGQLLSTRVDLMPDPYLKSLARLQDSVEPFPNEQAEEMIREELGVRISKAFSEFDSKPLASASLGQVYRARLRDGRQVVVKVQRPGIRRQIADDLEALTEIASFLDNYTDAGRRYQFMLILDEFQRNLVRELDYLQEARNLTLIGENLKEFDRIVIPKPVPDYSTHRVLTMDYVHGRKITSIGPLGRMEMHGSALAEELFRAYIKQILIDGMFHADPHPGNVFLTDDNRVALLDLGMIGRITPRFQDKLLQLLIAISEGHSDEAADIALELGTVRDDFNEMEFRRRAGSLVTEQQNALLGDIEIGRAVMEVSRASAENGVLLPTEFTMLGKTLLNLDEVARQLDPEFDPNDAIRRHASDTLRRRMLKSATSGNALNTILETKELMEHLPGRVNKILDALANNQLELKVEAIDEKTLIDGFQKVANRITVGLIVAALIVGAAMLMRIETHFRIFGYPGFAMLCFIIAGGIGLWLVMTVLIQDHRTREKSKG